MEISGFKADHSHQRHQSHVPQQSRRDKLRVQQVLSSTPISSSSSSSQPHHSLDNLSINALDHQFILHQDHANNLHQRNNARHAYSNCSFLYDHHGFQGSPDALDFSRNSSASMQQQQRGALAYQGLGGGGSDVPQSFMINWPNAMSFGNEGNDVAASLKARSGFSPAFLGNDVGHSNILEDQVVTVASTREVIRSSDDQSELALLPFSFANLENHGHQSWSAAADHHQLGGFDGDAAAKKRTTVANDSNLQGLSLSLSSIYPQQTTLPLPKPVAKPSIISKACAGKSLQDIVGVSSTSAYNNRSATMGPLGPFTGYATILKSSRFLKPAQQLLDEFCGSKLVMINQSGGTSTSCDHVNSGGEASGSISASDHGNNMVDPMDQSSTDHDDRDQVMGNMKSYNNNNNSCASSPTFYASNEINSSDHGGVGSNISFESGSSRPEQVQQKKAKLLYMQEEVSRRYKQYRQQMQMVVSSFESVAGLNSATPYISLALKAVTRHFRCLKGAIAEHLNKTRKALGEDLSSPATGTSSSKGADAIGPVRLKYMEQSFQKHRPSGANLAFSEPQQHHIWRPQRGLPERSVAVLRAWLFDHFLHPYPTDTDKHMLATQTGLTRNQVSNWFINARVRVWKPMVEEIHTLEMKGSNTGQGNSNKKHNDIGDIIPASNVPESSSTKLCSSAVFLNSKQLECPPGMGNYNSVGHNRTELSGGPDQLQHSPDKRSRLECQSQGPTSNMAGAVVQGFVPYHRSGLEVWSRAE